MPQDKFLQQVADYYLNKDTDLTKTTFVFPNRRSALFMRKYMHERVDKPHLMPRMISITYFTQRLSSSALAKPTELIFLLYNVYCNILKKHGRENQITDFDRFYFWGTIILNDFNDVDSYLVDASQLYKNLKDLKGIKTDFLTPEQIEVAKYLWGDAFTPYKSENFWLHDPHTPDNESASAKYLSLWQIMDELHTEFIKALDSQDTPLTYTGLLSRRAFERIKSMGKDEFKGQKYVFVGFNVLSTSRALIFKRLKDLGIAEFFWDIASPLVRTEKKSVNTAGSFVMPLSRSFPMPDDFELEMLHVPEDIEILSVPSNNGQAKVAAKIIYDWANNWKDKDEAEYADKLVNTAVVMADEHLLMPMLYSIPQNVKTINVTSGISYSSTPFSALMSAIISMHLSARKRQDTYFYFYQDVIDVLSHPHISIIAPTESKIIKDKIISEHLYTISADKLVSEFPSLAFIFNQIEDDKDIKHIRGYIDNLINNISKKLKAAIGNTCKTNYYELRILDGYTKEVEELCKLISDYKIIMQERTFLQMIERTLALKPVNFAGEPLKGLQLMSIMDTRTLDFENIIMLSMNERIFPKRNYTSSLIPTALRKGYGLPTQDHEEISYAYQFFRLISRAKKVRLLYDSRTAGITSGEKSRFLSQLLYIYDKEKIKIRNVEFKALTDEPMPIVVNKTPQVLKELNKFMEPGGPNLSASALKSYLSCPLKFYMQYVKGQRVNDTVLEYIDAASYGSVIHKVVQKLYELHKDNSNDAGRRDQIINEQTIEKMLNENLELMSLSTLNEQYYKSRYTSDLTKVPGEGQIIARIIAQYIRRMLKCEKSLAPFKFIGAELGEHISVPWKVNDKYTINFTMSIDRVDSFRSKDNPDEWVLRFIDYKTGSDSLRASNIDALFTDSNNSGIFQLLLYCHAYADIYNYTGKIKPIIYKFQTIPKDGIQDLKIGKDIIEDYRQADAGEPGEGFFDKFVATLDKIFEANNEYPFCQTDNIEHCRYCPFVQMCSKYPEDTDI